MPLIRASFLFLLSFVLLTAARAANTTATLLLDADQARPGDTVTAALRLRMNPGWHTYWENPGDSGLPTRVRWTFPAGFTNGPVQWPVPEKVVIGTETTLGYHGTATLLIPILVPADAPPGTVTLQARVSWLECETLCLPGNANLSVELRIGPERQPSAHGAVFEEARSLLPKTVGAEARAFWADTNPTNRALVVEWKTTAAGADFFPLKPGLGVTATAKTVTGQAGPDTRQIRLTVARDADVAWQTEIRGVLTEDAVSQKATGYEVILAIGEPPAGSGSSSDPAASSAVATTFAALALQLGLGFLGGLILNVMPCVLPVIALKILGVVNQSQGDPRKIRFHGLIYTLGVLVSFLVLAAVVIGLKAAGQAAGWGIQFGNPLFLVCLTTLVVLVALNLFGVFEIVLGGNVLTEADRLASRGGASGSFFNGVLATVLGTSCTAPFMGAAVGYAFAQGSLVTVLVFASIGLGLAFPYLLLSFQPAWLRVLPKPGAWMERFKVAMGFPMIATGVWLFTLAARRYHESPAWLGWFFVLLGLAAWIFGEFHQRGRQRRGLALGLALGTAVFAYVFVLEKQVDWRNPPAVASAAARADGVIKVGKSGIEWHRWSLAAIERAQAEGRPVLVDFTAEWCPNCKANEAFGIDVPEVAAKLREMNALALLAEYDDTPPEMTAEILRHGRAGISLVLVYPGRPGAKPEVLPELFAKGRMLEALERAEKDTLEN